MTEVDLHFWVLKDGEIIDNSIDLLRMMLGDIGGEQLVYLPYPTEIAETIIETEKQNCIRRMEKNGKTWEQGLIEGKDGKNNKVFNCIASSFCYTHFYGGKIQVGCLGYKKRDGKISWLYSHPDNAYDDYRRNPNDKLLNVRETYPTEHEGKLLWGEKLEKFLDEPSAKKKKQKPNEKCACNSGIKYKKCCGKN